MRAMIIALLVLIVLILLFGAGAVKGWIANVFTASVMIGAIGITLIWVGSFFGENGFLYVISSLGILFFGLVVWANWPSTPAVYTPPPPPIADLNRVWALYADLIEHRFSPAARAEATRLRHANDLRGLERFCRKEKEQLK